MPDYNADKTGRCYPQDFMFAGWYENELCEGDGISSSTGKTMPAQNITLYAKWQAPQVERNSLSDVPLRTESL